MYRLKEIAAITGSEFTGSHDHRIDYFLNDSRSLQASPGTLFIALRTARNDGHNYIPTLIEAGVNSFLVEKNRFDPLPHKDSAVSFLVAEDPLEAIQSLAAHHRSRFSIPVIGITGSNGKTVVKEWLYQALKDNYAICRSPKSYNSQVGVPLSVLNLNSTHTLAIFEAGISLPGEMQKLAKIIRPTVGIFTSLGSAHDAGFATRAEKTAEKIKLFEGADLVIFNGLSKNDSLFFQDARSVFVSEHEDADVRIGNRTGILSLTSSGQTDEFRLPFTDQASVYNAATCAVFLRTIGFDQQEIAHKLALLQPIALRLEIKNAINNALVINDYYNSDLDSMKIALNHLHHQNRRPRKVVIVSDIEQSGVASGELYSELSRLFSQSGIDLVIGIGEEISANSRSFPGSSVFYRTTRHFLADLAVIKRRLHNATILLKGARSFGFETISKVLQLKSHDTVFEINLNKLADNVNYYRSLLDKQVGIMCMVKAMGYGSGGSEIARTLQHIGVNYLAVAYADEGVELRESNVSLPIMVMSPEEDALEDIISNRLEPELYSFNVLQAFVSKLDSLGIARPYPVHIKIDTGMHRLGFNSDELEELAAKLKSTPQLQVRSVFSHLAASDNPRLDEFTNQQIAIFEKAVALIGRTLNYPVIRHICNSAGITRFKAAHYDMVRLGIGMYGMGVNDEEQAVLENVGTLKSRISQLKQVRKGQTVGYNRNGAIGRDTTIAVVPIGYADGFSRMLGNGAHGLYVKGRFCKTVGNICMDMCMIDVTGVDCKEGDEVIVFENADQINRMAGALNTISYEVLTGVSGRVKRVYIQE